MMLSKSDLDKLTKETRTTFLITLFNIEDELDYKNKDVSETIDYLQESFKGD